MTALKARKSKAGQMGKVRKPPDWAVAGKPMRVGFGGIFAHPPRRPRLAAERPIQAVHWTEIGRQGSTLSWPS
jgi:hypothetical protein